MQVCFLCIHTVGVRIICYNLFGDKFVKLLNLKINFNELFTYKCFQFAYHYTCTTVEVYYTHIPKGGNFDSHTEQCKVPRWNFLNDI